jgi:hypothetical protein
MPINRRLFWSRIFAIALLAYILTAFVCNRAYYVGNLQPAVTVP